MTRFPIIAAILALPALLGGCSLPDLVAHGVKSMEKNNQPRAAASQPAAATQPASYDRPAEEPPPPLVTPSSVPARESIKVEELK
jgi:hypothetical protein